MSLGAPNTRFYGACRTYDNFFYLIPILRRFRIIKCKRQAALHSALFNYTPLVVRGIDKNKQQTIIKPTQTGINRCITASGSENHQLLAAWRKGGNHQTSHKMRARPHYFGVLSQDEGAHPLLGGRAPIIMGAAWLSKVRRGSVRCGVAQ